VSRVTAGADRPDGVVLHMVRAIQAKVRMPIGSTLGACPTFEFEGVNEPAAPSGTGLSRLTTVIGSSLYDAVAASTSEQITTRKEKSSDPQDAILHAPD
jgi:hypothetical protein